MSESLAGSPPRALNRTIQVSPIGGLDVLSRFEVQNLLDTSNDELLRLFRQCSLAVLNSGSMSDDARQTARDYATFDIRILQTERGVSLELDNPPANAFVDGRIISGIRELLFAVLRDIVYVNSEIIDNPNFPTDTSFGVTNAVFHIMRNAGVLQARTPPNIVVCWGGHSIAPHEYDYTKDTGYQMGLRGFDICTGCGPGAMKGPMKGATIGHSKQRIRDGRYIGISEPGIIGAESPNPIVNELVIMPDIEKRLEAFVRLGHGIVVFPGGVGTAEEILYLLGILMHPNNEGMPFPMILTGPESARDYFTTIDEFIATTLGEEAQKRYEIIIDDAPQVARKMQEGVRRVRKFRKARNDAYHYNWLLDIPSAYQRPFAPTHENMRSLDLRLGRPPHELAADLRRAFSGIVAGNVKDEGLREVEAHGPFELTGDPAIMQRLDNLLTQFVDQGRMKLPGTAYSPCYRVVEPAA